MGFGYDEACGTNSHNDYVHVASDDPAGDKELVYRTLEVIAENALPRLDRFKAQGETSTSDRCFFTSFILFAQVN